MPPTPKSSFTRVNARGLIVMAVSVIILIVVLVVQFAGGEATSSRGSGHSAAASRARQVSDSPAREGRPPTDAHNSPDPWPSIPVERVIGYDPFRVSDAPAEDESSAASLDDEPEDADDVAAESRERIEAARRAALASLTKQGVGAYLSGGEGGNVAVIGDRTVRAGDVIDGFRVVAIGPDGVVVEPVELP